MSNQGVLSSPTNKIIQIPREDTDEVTVPDIGSEHAHFEKLRTWSRKEDMHFEPQNISPSLRKYPPKEQSCLHESCPGARTRQND